MNPFFAQGTSWFERLLAGAAFNVKWVSIYYIGTVLVFFALWSILRQQDAVPLQPKQSGARQIGREMWRTVIAMPVLGSFLPVAFALGLAQYVHIHREAAPFGWWGFAASLAAMMVIQDTYFYWTHRLMHLRGWYRWVHLTHHRSVSVNPWSTYSISLVEAVIDSGSAVFIVLLVPSSGLALLVFTLLNAAYAVYGHLGYEIMPMRFLGSRVGRWINSSVAHNGHHAKVRYNFGWYFLFWDRLMGTLDPDYDAFIARSVAQAAGRVPSNAASS